MKRSACVGALVAGIIAALVLAVPAPAGDFVRSKVTIKLGNDGATFKGRVTSNQDSCVVGRKVLLRRKLPGADQTITKTFASESGKWSAEAPMQAGNKIYAKVKDYDPPPPGDRTCLRDNSKTIAP